MIAHAGPVPIEELLLVSLGGASALLLFARAWLGR
jgi:hypothetical protein